jgi:FkbM family methyltransferase
MSINLNTLDGTPLNLHCCNEFLEYYNNPNSYTKHIIDLEINNGHYNDADFQKIFTNKDAVVVDAGANIGLFSLMVCKFSKKVFAVEPTTQHLNVLRTLCKIHDINNIEFCEFAFNNYNGTCNFAIDESNTTTNRIADAGNEIKCTRIYDFLSTCGESKIDLLKLDIEGGELHAVLNDDTFEKCASMVDNVYIEIHPPTVNPKAIVDKLHLMGYKVKCMNSEFLNNNLNVLAFK